MEKKTKAMSDGDVNDFVFNKLTGDLDDIESQTMFSDDSMAPQNNTDGVKMEAGGYSIHVKPMDGQQTKDMPKTMDAPEEDDELGKLGM